MVTRAEGKNDLVKYSVLLCGDDDDPAIVQAASGALAMLTSQSKKICNKIFDVCIITQCGKFRILLSLRFYVKSILGIMEVQKLPFLPFWGL